MISQLPHLPAAVAHPGAFRGHEIQCCPSGLVVLSRIQHVFGHHLGRDVPGAAENVQP